MVQIRNVAVAITQVLPGWLSSFALSMLFLAVWFSPSWLGWEGMGGLRVVVFVEVATVYGMLFILPGREERFAWLPIVPVAVGVGLLVGTQLNPILGAGLAIHIVARVAGVWADLRAARVILYELWFSLVLMICAWFMVALLPLPALGWTEADTPFRFWWQVPSWTGGVRMVPYALPAWGFLYFLCVAVIDGFHLARRVVGVSDWSQEVAAEAE
jgi:hypothetical protein